MADNPWNVDSIEAFTFLKCPECLFDTKEDEVFLEHAFENHPMSSVFFGKRLKKEVESEEYNSNIENFEENIKIESSSDIKAEAWYDLDENKSEYFEYQNYNETLENLDAKESYDANTSLGTKNRPYDWLPYRCSMCDYASETKSGISEHFFKNHENSNISESEKKEFKCFMCHYSSDTYSEMS